MKVEICDKCLKQYNENLRRTKFLLYVPGYKLKYKLRKIEMCNQCFEEFMEYNNNKTIKLNNNMFLTKCCHTPPITDLKNDGTPYLVCPSCSEVCECYDTDDSKPKKTNKYDEMLERFEKLGLLKKEEPKAVKTATEYEVSYNNIKLKVIKSENGKLTIEPNNTKYDNDGFVFMGSKPSMVKAIGKILIKASEL